MAKLRQLPPRPRRARRAPAYPRCLGLGVIALLAACGGSVEDGSGDETSGTGGATTTGSPTTTQVGGNGGAGGEGAAAGEGGAGGEVHQGGWGGGLDGMSADPFGGGGVGGYGDSAS